MTNDGSQASGRLRLVVNLPNQARVIGDPIPPRVTTEGQTLTYAWTQTAGTTVTLSDSTAAQPTFTIPDLLAGETMTFSLVVNDGTNPSTADTVDEMMWKCSAGE